jgi:N-acetylmuramoyl-L-alanine amidase
MTVRPPALRPGRTEPSAAGRARRRALARLGALALAVTVSDLARAVAILAVRVWPAADYTRVTIESDAPLTARQFLTPEGPLRLVIDIDGLELDGALRELVGKVKPDDPYIAGVRVGQYQPRTVRLVFDLKQAVAPQQFVLAPVAAYRHRLVLDLFPQVERDPLLALVQEREQASQQAAQAVKDALGEFIGRVERPMMAAPSAGTAAPGRTSGPSSGPTSGPTPGQAAPSTAAVQTPAPPAEAAPTALPEGMDRLIIVALDPGHGGEDPGAIGPTGLREKDVVLQIALQLRDRLNEQRGMRAMLTRDADFFVPLHQRVRKARRVQADLFVSIHADAFMRREARGGSVFALSTGAATSTAAKWMADRENAADLVGGVNVAVKDTQVLRAMLDMSTTAQIKDSLRAGQEVLSRLGRVGRLHKPQVEQAGFAVLKAPDIPSILVETAFISNPQEEALLRDPEWQTRLVEALAEGIRRYFLKNPPLARQRRA